MIERDETDQLLREAAYNEFLEKGYRAASMRNICARANMTTGAMYTRYKNKDELFVSLFENVTEGVDRLFYTLRPAYYRAAEEGIDDFIDVIDMETSAITALIYKQFDLFRLLLLHSEGSSMEGYFDRLVQRKIDETMDFFKAVSKTPIDEKSITLIMSGQFQLYRTMIGQNYTRKEAMKAVRYMNAFNHAGFKRIMEEGV